MAGVGEPREPDVSRETPSESILVGAMSKALGIDSPHLAGIGCRLVARTRSNGRDTPSQSWSRWRLVPSGPKFARGSWWWAAPTAGHCMGPAPHRMWAFRFVLVQRCCGPAMFRPGGGTAIRPIRQARGDPRVATREQCASAVSDGGASLAASKRSVVAGRSRPLHPTGLSSTGWFGRSRPGRASETPRIHEEVALAAPGNGRSRGSTKTFGRTS
jgi:hypothetical protein